MKAIFTQTGPGLTIVQGGLGPIVQLGFGSTGQAASLGDAPAFSSVGNADTVLLERTGELIKVPASAFVGFSSPAVASETTRATAAEADLSAELTLVNAGLATHATQITALTGNQAADELTVAALGASLTSLGNAFSSLPPVPSIGRSRGMAAPGGASAGVLALQDFAANVGTGSETIDTQAMAMAMAQAGQTRGMTVLCPPNLIKLVSTNAYGFVIPSYTTLQMVQGGSITWNDADSANPNNILFTSGTQAAPTTNVRVVDMIVNGTFLQNGCTVAVGGRSTGSPYLFEFVGQIEILGGLSYGSRFVGCRLQYCNIVRVDGLRVEHSGRDGLDVVWGSDIFVNNYRARYTGDDGLGLHSNPGDTNGIRVRVVVTNVSLFCAQGMNVVGAKKLLASNIQMDYCKKRGLGIYTHALPVAGQGGDAEGANAALDIQLANISMTNMIQAPGLIYGQAAGSGSGYGIIIAADSANPGGFTNFVGPMPSIIATATAAEKAYAPNGIVDRRPFSENIFTNQPAPRSAASPIPGSGRISLSNILCAVGMPPADGSVINPITRLPYSKVSDLSVWLPQGLQLDSGSSQGAGAVGAPLFYNGPLPASEMGDYAVSMSIGVMTEVIINGLNVFGGEGGVYFGNSYRYDNIRISNFIIVGVREAAFRFDSTGASNITIEHGSIDSDPDWQHVNRGPGGTWAMPAAAGALQTPMAVFMNAAGGGATLESVKFQNVFRILGPTGDTSFNNGANGGPNSNGSITNVQFLHCYAYGHPVAEGYNAGNQGIGVVDPEGGVTWQIVNFNTASANFGGVDYGASLMKNADSIPISGFWVRGRHLKFNTPYRVGRNLVLGCYRLTTGATNSHFPQVPYVNADWLPIQAAIDPAQTTTYTAAGTISLLDTVTILNSPKAPAGTAQVPMAMILPNPTSQMDGYTLLLKNFGQAASVTGRIDGVGRTLTWNTPAGVNNIGDSCTLVANVATNSWLYF